MVKPFDPILLQAAFPAQRPVNPDVFEIGIAAAGGTSTGAYVAGVLDFIIEALDAWEAEPLPEGALPKMPVKLRVMSGTSAGGLGVALASLYTFKTLSHAYDSRKWAALGQTGPQPLETSALYRAWVEEISFDRLLAPGKGANPDISLFAPAPGEIRDTVFAMINNQPSRAWPAWAETPLELRVTVGNLRGVPYSLTFADGAPGVDERLVMHRDHVAFAICPTTASEAEAAPDTHTLRPGTFNNSPEWATFGTVAIASSAIPLVFAPQEVKQNPNAYDWRDSYWDPDLPYGAPPPPPGAGVPIRPSWAPPWTVSGNTYTFTATDGGVFDNAPFTLAHRALAGARGRNARSGQAATRAIIMVDPVVNETAGTPIDPLADETASPKTALRRLIASVAGFVLSPIAQSRASTVDLALLSSEDVYSRFLICPSRTHPADDNKPEDDRRALGSSKSLLTGPLFATLGFAHKDYRHHDFMLGRRNAQRLLSHHFTLPHTHPLVQACGGWEPGDMQPKANVPHWPIIPLRGRCRIPEPLPLWTWNSLKGPAQRAIRDNLGKRLDGIWDKIKASFLDTAHPKQGLLGRLINGLGNLVAGPLLWAAWRGKLRPMILDAVEAKLAEAVASRDPAHL
jgi:hypothetical protein